MTDLQKQLIANEYAEECPACGAISAYAWDDVNWCPPASIEPEELAVSERVYHIGSASCFEWECGCCGCSWTPVDSPLNSPCYTHSDDN